MSQKYSTEIHTIMLCRLLVGTIYIVDRYDMDGHPWP